MFFSARITAISETEPKIPCVVFVAGYATNIRHNFLDAGGNTLRSPFGLFENVSLAVRVPSPFAPKRNPATLGFLELFDTFDNNIRPRVS